MSDWTWVDWAITVIVVIVGVYMTAMQILLIVSVDRAREDLRRKQNERQRT